MKKGTSIIITGEKLVFGGQALCHYDGKSVFAWNVLPGEIVEAEVIKKKSSHIEALGRHIIKQSPHRISPEEDHHLSCSPWQIISWAEENKWKKLIADEVYKRIGGNFPIDDLKIITNANEQFHYRNKIEYSFAINNDNEISLAFFSRGTHTRVPISYCALAQPSINEAALSITRWLNTYNFPIRSLKSLIMRTNEVGNTIAALFIKDRVSIIKSPALRIPLDGMSIYYSHPRSPASRPDELLLSKGSDYLCTTINGIALKYGVMSFFQVNIQLFKHALDDIKNFLDPKKILVDYYCGVGAISIPLAPCCTQGILIENNDEAVAYARENIRNNTITHFTVHNASTEKALEFIQADRIILFDPPRAGLHKKIIAKLLEERPFRIIYLSCNLATQARDVHELLSCYTISLVRLYNFFPRTPHIEGLCILDRKN
ncbi:MAG: methyltransferase [Candidatus Omnitrophica bacterium]|nr:methyltransferase [Candidatus Omnitrophota bacterium]